MEPSLRKRNGAYYTPDAVVSTLLSWAVRNPKDRLLDPSCGDGRFIAGHGNSVGIEQDADATRVAHARAPWAFVHEADFFTWANDTTERFECAAGNPPFIRYQTFKGKDRKNALGYCARLGVHFSGLTSSWAPFLAATASLLKPGGRMAFVVPAEIGHAPYSAPLFDYLVRNFAVVQVIATQTKIFPELSEDCWLLYADGFGASTQEIRFTAQEKFASMPMPPRTFEVVLVSEWREIWKRRLRSFLMPKAARSLYEAVATHPDSHRFGDVATIGIGYVSGANEFFHLRPSAAGERGIPQSLLHPTVRNGRVLPRGHLTAETIERWCRNDDPILLLRIPKDAEIPPSVQRYLDTDEGIIAREAYKCRTRDPWYSVPDVQFPDLFLTYMSGRQPSLVRNDAGCTCTNSIHGVRIKRHQITERLSTVWESPFVKLSCEIEGHPLGGGLLKLEPREAAQIVLPSPGILAKTDKSIVDEAVTVMRDWRHCAAEQ